MQGSAEVVFVRRSDAVAAVKKYNNVQLDGKLMKIELIGSNVGLPTMPRFNVFANSDGRGKRTVVMMYVFLCLFLFLFLYISLIQEFYS